MGNRMLDEAAEWSEKTFLQSTVQSVKTHLLREWEELLETGFSDPSEFADVVLLMNHLAFKKGFSLGSATEDKFEVNKARKWGGVDEEGVVEHVREGDGVVELVREGDTLNLYFNEFDPKKEGYPVHYMKTGPDVKPYETPDTTVYGPPVFPTYRASIVEGQVVIEKMVYQNHSGGEDRWVDVDKNSTQRVDFTMRSKMMELLDIGVISPIQLSVQTTVLGEPLKPILNERWEDVVETSNGKFTGRKGKVRAYRQGGKEFVSEIVWNE